MPLELRLEYCGEGKFRTATRLDWDLCQKELASRRQVFARISKPRSARQNAMFHAMIQDAFLNQRAGPQFPTWEHLKGWLLIQAGHCEVMRFDPEAMTPAVAARLRHTFTGVDFTADRSSIYMKIAKSVSFAKADADVMKDIVDRVIDIICTEIVPGTTPDELTQATGMAA